MSKELVPPRIEVGIPLSAVAIPLSAVAIPPSAVAIPLREVAIPLSAVGTILSVVDILPDMAPTPATLPAEATLASCSPDVLHDWARQVLRCPLQSQQCRPRPAILAGM